MLYSIKQPWSQIGIAGPRLAVTTLTQWAVASSVCWCAVPHLRCAPPTCLSKHAFGLGQSAVDCRGSTSPPPPPPNKTKNTLPCYTQNIASQQNIVAALKKEDGVHVEVEVEEDVSVALNSPEKLELEVEESFCAQLCQLVSNKMYVVLTLALCATRATFATVDRPAFWGRATLQDICLSIHPMKLWEVGAAIL